MLVNHSDVVITRLNFVIRTFLFVAFVFIANTGIAQENTLSSTIEQATQLRDAGDFEQAVQVLEEFNSQQPGNIWVMQLWAETLFWMKDYDYAAWVYEDAIRKHPENLEVKYEYALMLFEQGNYPKVRDILVVYTDNNAENAGAESILGITNYYLGYFKQADEHLEKSLTLNPGDQRTREIHRQVARIVRPWIRAGVSYTDDSQPLKQWVPVLEGGWYQSHFLNLSFLLDMQNFSSDTIQTNRYNFELQNSFQFPKAGFSAKLRFGGFYSSINQAVDYTWGVSLHQKIAKHLHLRVGGERSAYTHTLSSIVSPFTRGRYNVSLSWEKPKKWNANVGYIGEYFPDDNNVQTYYAWGLSPAISFSVIELYFGYAYNYADSKESRYVPEKSLDEILDDYNPDEQIKGIYDPYFTPDKQYAHSAISNLFIIPSNTTSIKLHASVGFYARAMNPYFYLDKKNSGKTYIRQGFYQESFTPLDMGIDFTTGLSDKMELNFSYTYLQTFYFNSNNFHLGLKIYF